MIYHTTILHFHTDGEIETTSPTTTEDSTTVDSTTEDTTTESTDDAGVAYSSVFTLATLCVLAMKL
jgi:hypothetical protein